MSPKSQALFRLYISIAVTALPGLGVVWASSGYIRAGAALTLAGMSLAIIWHAYQTNISNLSNTTTPPAAGSGTADTTSKTTSPPTAGRFALRFGLLALIAVLTLGSKCNSGQALNDFTPAGQCFFSAALSGKIDFANPATAALQLLALCAGTTTADVINWIAQMTGTDAGIGADPKAPTAAQLQAVLAAVKALPPTFTTGDAIRMLGSSKVTP